MGKESGGAGGQRRSAQAMAAEEPMTVRTIDLDREQLMMFEGRPGMRVRVLFGTMWLTQSGSAHDAFVDSGGEVALQGPGKVVLEGVGPARVLVARPIGRSGEGLGAVLYRLFDAWRARPVPPVTQAVGSLRIVSR